MRKRKICAMCDTMKIYAFLIVGMFNGLRKIVGAIGGSAEDLDTTPDLLSTAPPTTPYLNKSTKKRKVLDTAGFSNRKK